MLISHLFQRAKTPTLLQMEAVECGAASLGIILTYYGRIVPLAKLREECGVSRDGTNAWNLLQVAQNYGFNAKGLKLSIEQLRTLRPPYIVFWNFNHFLVVEGFGKQRVYLNDPGVGRRTVSLQEFGRSYTGVALVMEPGATFRKGGQKRNSIASLVKRLQPSWSAVLFCFLAGLLLTLPRLAVPVFSQVFVDEILVQSRYGWLRPLLIGMGITAVLRWFLTQLRLTYLRRLMVKLSITFSTQFMLHALHLPLGFYVQRYAGEISNRLSLNDRVAEVLSGRLATTAIDALMMLVYLLIMVQYNGKLTAIAVGFASLNFLALWTFSQAQIDANVQLAQEQGKVVGVTVSGIQAIETVKASGLESDVFARFAGHYAKMLNIEQKLGVQTQLLAALPTVLTAFTTTAILVVGGLEAMQGHLSIGMLVAYLSLTQSFLEPVNGLVNFGSTLQALEADLDRLDDVLSNDIDREIVNRGTKEIKPEKTDSPNLEDSASNILYFSQNSSQPPLSQSLTGHLQICDLTFGYSPVSPPLIKDFHLTVQPGQRVALVGGSGSGKSTIARLIAGLYQPWEGSICLDGVPRTQIDRSILTSALAMVDQDVFLFAGTVRENLTLWDLTIPQDDLVRACQDAAIHDVIVSLPGTYDAPLPEGGLNLSGGQRQRLEIARALVKNPTILILDEATSALDSEIEQVVDRNLQNRGCTCIIVAHRLSTIRDCDEILVLEQGRVVERGTHEDLWRQGGAYVRLLQSEVV